MISMVKISKDNRDYVITRYYRGTYYIKRTGTKPARRVTRANIIKWFGLSNDDMSKLFSIRRYS